MATEESNIVQNTRIEVSKEGARVFRNNRGMFYTIDSVKKLLKLMQEKGFAAANDFFRNGGLRINRAGLEVPGSSDLIGWTPILITPEMVGKEIAVFTGLEAKTEKGKVSPDQVTFMQNLDKAGGITGVVRSENDFKGIKEAFIKRMKKSV